MLHWEENDEECIFACKAGHSQLQRVYSLGTVAVPVGVVVNRVQRAWGARDRCDVASSPGRRSEERRVGKKFI